MKMKVYAKKINDMKSKHLEKRGLKSRKTGSVTDRKIIMREEKDEKPKLGVLPNINVLTKSQTRFVGQNDQIDLTIKVNPVESNTGKLYRNSKDFSNGSGAFNGVDGNWSKDMMGQESKFTYSVLGNGINDCENIQSSSVCDRNITTGTDTGEIPLAVRSAGVVSLVSKRGCRDVSFQDGEKASYADQENYANHPGSQLHPLTPVMISREHPSSDESGADISPQGFHYPNPVSAWEQENNGYGGPPWKNPDMYQPEAYNGFGNSNSDNNNMNNYSSCHSSAYMSDGSSEKLSVSNGRRRRKRVQTPVQRTAANMRERRRMCHLNVAFDRLKEHLPNVKDKKKLSRIQTLKAAIFYIHVLRDSLNLH